MPATKVGKGYDFSGIYVPITTPFNKDESIAWDKLESNIKKMNSTKVKGYVVQGSTGEFCYLSTDEKIKTISKVKPLAKVILHEITVNFICNHDHD